MYKEPNQGQSIKDLVENNIRQILFRYCIQCKYFEYNDKLRYIFVLR